MAPSEPPAESASVDEWLRETEQALPAELLEDTAPRAVSAAASEAPAEPLAASQAEAPALGEGQVTEVAGDDTDEALRWLESLAVRQGANAEELLTSPEERPAETPAWIAALQVEATAIGEAGETEAQAPAEPDTVASVEAVEAELAPAELEAELPGLPEPASLAELAASVPAEPLEAETPSQQATVPTEAELTETLDEDEALRWLEGLAAQQGARAEELLTSPEERPTETPAWIAAQQRAEPDKPVEPEQPEWLPTEPEPLAAVHSALEPAAEPEPAAGADDEALRWLESLAARQGASPDDLLATPAERLVQTPEWIAAEQAATMQAQPESDAEAGIEPPPLAEPEPAASILPPDWEPAPPGGTGLAQGAPPDEGVATDAATRPTGEPEADLDRLSRLADRLAAARRNKEIEIEARFAEQRAQQEAARRQVQERMEAWRQTVEAEAAPPAPPAPSVEPPAAPVATPTPPPAAAVTDYAAEVGRYASQVEAGADLDKVVRDLRQLAAAPHAPMPVWRLLGDVFARRNELQEALEAYRTALGRLAPDQ
jgi:hypothetical protein